MYSIKQIWNILKEIRILRRYVGRLKRAVEQHRTENKKLLEENKKLKESLKNLQGEQTNLEEKVKSLTDQRDRYKGMIFKANTEPKEKSSERQRGAQKGHKSHNRITPKQIDAEKEIHISHCPDCHTKLKKTNSYKEKIIEDIPKESKAITIRYKIQRQWCPKCKKEVSAVPIGTLEGSRFGINVTSFILYARYKERLPLNLIEQSLKDRYQLKITQGGIQYILHKVKERFGKEYGRILKTFQQNPRKYADETSWRNQGSNYWLWLFACDKAIYYTIEETRGKGVPEKIIGDDPKSVLVRDDYAGYTKLNIQHQSCWAHLLRVSHDLAKKDTASNEMKELHIILKIMFSDLKLLVDNNDLNHFGEFKTRIQNIIDHQYISKDASEVQTRIANQNENLLTALRFPNVQLTNNFAERNIRPLTVIRKISGGSQSDNGAATTAVNMSVIQTLSLKSGSFLSDLSSLLNHYRFALSETPE